MRRRIFSVAIIFFAAAFLAAGTALADSTAKATFSIKQEMVFQGMPLAVDLENQQQLSEFEVQIKFTDVVSGRGVLPTVGGVLPTGWQSISLGSQSDGILRRKCWRTKGAEKIDKGERIILELYFLEAPLKLKLEMSATANGKPTAAVAPDELVVLPPIPPPPPWPLSPVPGGWGLPVPLF